jgi:hypothetical protein
MKKNTPIKIHKFFPWDVVCNATDTYLVTEVKAIEDYPYYVYTFRLLMPCSIGELIIKNEYLSTNDEQKFTLSRRLKNFRNHLFVNSPIKYLETSYRIGAIEITKNFLYETLICSYDCLYCNYTLVPENTDLVVRHLAAEYNINIVRPRIPQLLADKHNWKPNFVNVTS